jgi:HEPN domain-containing protein
MVTRKEEENRLLKRSRDFPETAEYQTGKGCYDLTAFSLEQGMQFFCKPKCWLKELTIQEHTASGLS